jgi:hypothetical protein
MPMTGAHKIAAEFAGTQFYGGQRIVMHTSCPDARKNFGHIRSGEQPVSRFAALSIL